jgi:hypothetical protein
MHPHPPIKTLTLELPDNIVEALSVRFGAMNTLKWADHILYFLERNFQSFANENRAMVAQLENIERLIADEQIDEAQALIRDIRYQRGDFPALVGLQARLDILGFLAAEEETEKHCCGN